MFRWVQVLLLAGAAQLCAQDAPPQTPAPQQKPGELKKGRKVPETSEQEEVPPEEDASLAATPITFNPLQSDREIRKGDFYAKTRKNIRAAAGAYKRATLYNEGNS